MNNPDNKIDLLESEICKTLQVLNKMELFYKNNHSILDEKNDIRNLITLSEIFINYYTCLETIFLRISTFFENNLPADKWHSELLNRMILEVKPLRTKVIADETFAILDEFRRFQHFKRYYFDFSYDAERLDYLRNKFERLPPLIHKDLKSFLKFLENLKNTKPEDADK